MGTNSLILDTTRLMNPADKFTQDELAILRKIPHTAIVKNHLLRFGYITDKIARDYYGISRLADVVYKLRYKIEPRMDIFTEYVTGKNRFGKTVVFAKYKYEEDTKK